MDAPKKGLLQELLSNVWWIVLLRGMFLGFIGLMLLMWPGETVLVLVMFLGAYFFIAGIFTVINAIQGRKVNRDWGWDLFFGIVYILAGVIVFMRPVASALFTEVFLVYMLAFVALFGGIVRIFTGIRLRKEIEGEWALILTGILFIIFSIILMLYPVMSGVALIWTIGIFAIIGGIILTVLAFRLHRLAKQAA